MVGDNPHPQKSRSGECMRDFLTRSLVRVGWNALVLELGDLALTGESSRLSELQYVGGFQPYVWKSGFARIRLLLYLYVYPPSGYGEVRQPLRIRLLG